MASGMERRRVDIVGAGHTRFGRFPETSFEDLILQAGEEALGESGLSAGDIDYAVVAHYNAGLMDQQFTAGYVISAFPELNQRPISGAASACASGSAAIYDAVRMIETRRAQTALVVGFEKMTHRPSADVGEILLKAGHLPEVSHIRGGFAGTFAEVATAYGQRYGSPLTAMAKIASKNHINGCTNALAQLRKPFDVDFCDTVSDRNPEIVTPLRLTDCSPISDGAAALVLAAADVATDGPRVAFRSAEQTMDTPKLNDREDVLAFAGCRQAWRKGLDAAGVSLNDLDLVETHDCFTIAELIQYEAMGLAEPGRGADVLEAGVTHPDGALPVNLSGGLKAKGHPIGATGVSMHAVASRYLTGAAEMPGASQPTLAGVFNMGGVAVSNFCSILERVR